MAVKVPVKKKGRGRVINVYDADTGEVVARVTHDRILAGLLELEEIDAAKVGLAKPTVISCIECGAPRLVIGHIPIYCLACLPEKRRQSAKKYREANREKRREYNRKWAAANPEKVREKSRRWAAANPERVRENLNKRRRANPEKYREENRKWRQANPEKAREIARKSRQKRDPEKHKEAERERRKKNIEKQREYERKYRERKRAANVINLDELLTEDEAAE